MAAITIWGDFGAPQNKVWHCFHCFPIYFPWNDGTRCYAVFQIEGEKVEVVTDFLFVGSKTTVDCDSSHENKGWLLLGRKSMTNLDSMLKSRDITLLTKVHMVKAMVFPVVMFSCESWTIKEIECQRIDAFKLWSWRSLLNSLGQQGNQTSQS